MFLQIAESLDLHFSKSFFFLTWWRKSITMFCGYNLIKNSLFSKVSERANLRKIARKLYFDFQRKTDKTYSEKKSFEFSFPLRVFSRISSCYFSVKRLRFATHSYQTTQQLTNQCIRIFSRIKLTQIASHICTLN